MALKKLELRELATISHGRLAAAFDHHLEECIADCLDRPAVNKPRAVTVTVEIRPKDLEKGELETIATVVKIGAKLPGKATAPITMDVRKSQKGAQAVYNDHSPDDPKQRTLDEVIDPGPEE